MYKCAVLGCGGRARGHVRAYQHVERGKVAAICDMNEALLQKFGDEFGINQRYTNFEQMLDVEKPDLVHIVTAPVLRGTNQLIRHSLMRTAAEHGVPAAIVEKPIAVMGEDWREISELSKRSRTKFVVNTQLHFHPQNLALKRDVSEGKIGQLKFIEASARNPPVDQAPHVLQLVSSYIDNSRPVQVMGQISGGRTLDSTQPSPDNATALITYENGVQASVAFGAEMAPRVLPDTSNNRHKRVCVFGTHGFVHWRFESWERYLPNTGYEGGDLNYGAQDVIAQAGLTEAVFDWLDDERKIHPTHLEQSLAEFNLLLGIYYSGMTHAPVKLPFQPPNGLIDSLKQMLQ